jgi:hypothetical protein
MSSNDNFDHSVNRVWVILVLFFRGHLADSKIIPVVDGPIVPSPGLSLVEMNCGVLVFLSVRPKRRGSVLAS